MSSGKKKIVAIIASACLSVISCFGQIADSYYISFDSSKDSSSVTVSGYDISIDYSVGSMDINVISDNNSKYFKINLPDHIPSEIEGEPELPIWNRLIVIPEGYKYTIKVSNVVSKEISLRREGIKALLFPAQENASKNGKTRKQKIIIDKKLYRSDLLAGFDTIRLETIGKSRGKTLAILSVSPMRYNPVKEIIDVIVSMKIDITFEKDGTDRLENTVETPVFRELISSQTVNYNKDEVVPGYSEEPIKMILVTDSSFVETLDPYIEWKTEKGIDVVLLSIGKKLEGCSSLELRDTIRNIYNYHLQEGSAPDYLLIVGNTTIIPNYEGAGNVTDVYYGEMDGGDDYIPEMLIGRLPAGDTTEIKNMTSKIVQYERYDFEETNEFTSNALMFTGSDNTYSSIMNGQVRYGIENYLIPENNINEYHFYHFDVTKEALIDIINMGTSFINYTGHGISTQLMTVGFSTADTVLLSNRYKYPVFISNACKTSTFNVNSLGNIMVKAKDKGMVGFIGSSGDTYWNEDFYWSVGLAYPTATPTYETTALGAMDRLFHTHEENAPEWYTSLGEILYAGNMSVSASTSIYKQRYWERYNIVGDPSLVPMMGTPEPIIVSVPDTIPNLSGSISFQGEPFLYAAVTMHGILMDASHIGISGVINLEFPEVSNDSVLLVITGQNKTPYFKTIYINDITNEFITLTSHSFNDDNGNSNGIAEYGESINIDLSVSNVGSTDATGLYIKASSPSNWIEMVNDSLFIGTLQAPSAVDISNQLSFMVKDSIPNDYSVPFDLMLKDDYGEKHNDLSVTIYAPSVTISSVYMDDSQTGDGDFVADPGEMFQLVYLINNDGDVAVNGNLTVNADNPDVRISSSLPVFIEAKSSVSIPVDIEQTGVIPLTTLILFEATFSATPYEASANSAIKIGGIRESFESGDMNSFPWINESPLPWVVTSNSQYDGNYSARSGIITHNQNSTLTINGYYPEEDTLSFYYRVSSESSYDFFIFKVNGVIKFKVSGQIDWREARIKVPSGYNRFEWSYQKDKSVSDYEDLAMIDMIDFAKVQQIEFIGSDIGLHSIVSPQEKERGIEELSVTVFNLGADSVKGFELGYKVNNGPEVTQAFEDTIYALGDTISVTFDQKIDLSSIGVYAIEVYNKRPDDYRDNDTLRLTIVNVGYDLEISGIVSPVQNDDLGREIVTVAVKNNGPENLERFTLAYTINGTNKFTETFEETLNAGNDPVNVSFLQKANLSFYGEYAIKVFSVLANDVNRTNDTLSVILRNNDMTSLPDNPYDTNSITPYPNPFSSKLYILIKTDTNATAIITTTNIAGKTIGLLEQHILPGDNIITIDGDHMPQGIYLITANINGKIYTRKVLKQ